jgi:hypothetical protein
VAIDFGTVASGFAYTLHSEDAPIGLKVKSAALLLNLLRSRRTVAVLQQVHHLHLSKKLHSI